MNPARKKIIDDKLLELIAKDIQPFSVVEDTGFRDFCHALNPSYVLPSRKTLSKTLIPAKYLDTLNKTKGVVSNVESVTITTDLWSSRNNDSYMGVTGHFIDANYVVKSVLLDIFLFKGFHTSANLADELLRIVKEWDLEKKKY
ncbi:unnamed protein product [Psylliodes chrysocephalus]|uniref:Uncharacterized protein n=1 Tax=Psylliodes chrysocephalus TaxID=3402493 RepID=A0A9P0GNS9_9CUCU|nr:unnamed protein product [Psylliodes chrysocephala]